jgi:hypothetical protein
MDEKPKDSPSEEQLRVVIIRAIELDAQRVTTSTAELRLIAAEVRCDFSQIVHKLLAIDLEALMQFAAACRWRLATCMFANEPC